MNNSEENLSYCNFAKTLLMLCVVLCHSVAFYGGNWFTALESVQTNRFLGLFSSWLGTFHVQAFTLISGYIFYYLKKETGKYSDCKAFIINKVRRLLIPYVAISIIWIIPIGYLYYRYTFNDIIQYFILGQSPAQLWFLLMLFNVFVISYFLLNNNIAWQWWGVAGIGFLCMLSTLVSTFFPNYFQFLTSMKFILFFYAGCLIRRHCSEITPKSMLRMGCVFLLFNLLFFILRERLNWSVFPLLRIIKYFLSCLCELSGAVMAFFLLSYFASIVRWKNALFESLSKASFPIYMFHQQIIYFLLWHFSVFCTPITMSVICFCCSELISWAIGTMMNKSKLTRIIIGGR